MYDISPWRRNESVLSSCGMQTSVPCAMGHPILVQTSCVVSGEFLSLSGPVSSSDEMGKRSSTHSPFSYT